MHFFDARNSSYKKVNYYATTFFKRGCLRILMLSTTFSPSFIFLQQCTTVNVMTMIIMMLIWLYHCQVRRLYFLLTWSTVDLLLYGDRARRVKVKSHRSCSGENNTPNNNIHKKVSLLPTHNLLSFQHGSMLHMCTPFAPSLPLWVYMSFLLMQPLLFFSKIIRTRPIKLSTQFSNIILLCKKIVTQRIIIRHPSIKNMKRTNVVGVVAVVVVECQVVQ